jgi:hypothetical protein
MSTQPKLRSGNSELTKLKELWLKPAFADSRDYWSEQFASSRSQADLRGELLKKLKVNLRFDKQLTEFRQWATAQEQRELMAEKIEARKQELLAGGMTLAEAQEVLLTDAAAYSTAARDFKLGLRVSREISTTKRDSLESRRIALLEKKAEAFDRAQAALTEAKNSKGGITPETLKRIETELRLL